MALNTVDHMMFQCSTKSIERDEFWIKVLAACPKQLKTEILLMPFKERCFLYSVGFYSLYKLSERAQTYRKSVTVCRLRNLSLFAGFTVPGLVAVGVTAGCEGAAL